MVRWNGNYSAEFSIKTELNKVLCFRPYSTVFTLTICFCVLGKIDKVAGSMANLWGYLVMQMIMLCYRLQHMLNICEQYAKEHNLSFSTNQTINKCKTKCMAFNKKERDLRSMMLCENSLPWVKSTRHLGNKIEDKIDGTRQGMREKSHSLSKRITRYAENFLLRIRRQK